MLRWVKTQVDTHQGKALDVADIGKKIKGAATQAAKDKVSGGKKGKSTGGSKNGVNKAEKALKNRLK